MMMTMMAQLNKMPPYNISQQTIHPFKLTTNNQPSSDDIKCKRTGQTKKTSLWFKGNQIVQYCTCMHSYLHSYKGTKIRTLTKNMVHDMNVW